MPDDPATSTSEEGAMNKEGKGSKGRNGPFAGTIPHGKQGETATSTRERDPGSGHSSGDRNEDQYRHDTATGDQDQDGGKDGRVASDESCEDDALVQARRASTGRFTWKDQAGERG